MDYQSRPVHGGMLAAQTQSTGVVAFTPITPTDTPITGHINHSDQGPVPVALEANIIPNLLHQLLRWPGRMVTGLVSGLLALVILFEEWGWVPLQHLLARIGRWPGLRWVEGWVRSRPPWAAVALFALPTALLLPVKLLALWAMGQGHVVLGMLVIALAKVVGTAVVARLFTLTQPALMQLGWFAWAYTHWMGFKHRVLERARASWAWRAARVLRRHWVQRWRRR